MGEVQIQIAIFVLLKKLRLMQLHDLHFKPFISETEISEAVDSVAGQINKDYQGLNPIFLCVLNGSFMFAADLVRRFKGNCEISFTKLASYEGTNSSGDVKTLLGVGQTLKDRNVIIVEDIVDTGNTLAELQKILEREQVKSFRTATLFFKPEAYGKSLAVEYVGMSISNDFIVGYGLDYKGLGRNLPQIYILKNNNMTNLVLFGPPGAGKGTQASILKDKYNLVHISTGDVFRYNIKNETALGTEAKSYMDKGKLVPDTVTINMLRAEVEKNEGAKGFIFDGFPRTVAQAEALDKLLKEKNTEVSAMISLEVPDKILVQRLLERGKTSGRKDDADVDIISNRIKVYYEETAILKQFYLKENKFYGVDGVGSIEEIKQRLSEVIDTL